MAGVVVGLPSAKSSPPASNNGVIMLKAVVVALTLVAAQPVIAGQRPSGSSPARFGALRPQAAQPYKSLFKVATLSPPGTTQSTANDPSKPTVVCGMTLIPANPNIDPKMNVTPKTDGTRYTIRAIEPPICWAPTPPTR
jgi:hypothetical protein